MFEERAAEPLKTSARSASISTSSWRSRSLLDYVHIERSEIEETGEATSRPVHPFGPRRDRRQSASYSIPWKRCSPVCRITPSSAELRRLFRWLKDRGLTQSSPARRRRNAITRWPRGYVADCVITLDQPRRTR
jgi:circadian clock protein KaiC